MKMNARVGMNTLTPAAVIGPQSTPYSRTNLVNPSGNVVVLSLIDRVSVTIRSFHVQRNASTPAAARSGFTSGSAMRNNAPNEAEVQQLFSS